MIIYILVLILLIAGGYAIWKVFDTFIFPIILEASTEVIEKNPKWIMEKLKKSYYGFNNIDILLVNSKLGMLPRFRGNAKEKRIELLISNDEVTTDDVEKIGRLALIGKLKIQYALTFSDKPLYWLSIMCFMLDGGDIEVKDKKSLD